MIPGVLDREVRVAVYERTIATGAVPKTAALVEAVGAPLDQLRASLERLAEARVLVLDRDTREILMAMPFSSEPTPFVATVDGKDYFANCAWDAFGIPALLGREGRVTTTCGCCSKDLAIDVGPDGPQGSAVVHFAVPARRFWDNIVFT